MAKAKPAPLAPVPTLTGAEVLRLISVAAGTHALLAPDTPKGERPRLTPTPPGEGWFARPGQPGWEFRVGGIVALPGAVTLLAIHHRRAGRLPLAPCALTVAVRPAEGGGLKLPCMNAPAFGCRSRMHNVQ